MEKSSIPVIQKGSSIQLVVIVSTVGPTHITSKRAMHYANELETHINGGVETFTGWCTFLPDGTRVGALAKNERVSSWDWPNRLRCVTWVKNPILPEVAEGEIRQFLISFIPFGEKNPKTMAAYFANNYEKYSGWVVGHTAYGVTPFITIGDVITAWAELPSCDILPV